MKMIASLLLLATSLATPASAANLVLLAANEASVNAAELPECNDDGTPPAAAHPGPAKHKHGGHPAYHRSMHKPVSGKIAAVAAHKSGAPGVHKPVAASAHKASAPAAHKAPAHRLHTAHTVIGAPVPAANAAGLPRIVVSHGKRCVFRRHVTPGVGQGVGPAAPVERQGGDASALTPAIAPLGVRPATSGAANASPPTAGGGVAAAGAAPTSMAGAGIVPGSQAMVAAGVAGVAASALAVHEATGKASTSSTPKSN